MDIARYRLHNQRIARPDVGTPAEVVAWLGAVQAQDYPGALWAVGLRTPDATQADVERALADGTILRTWPMRGTLHFVAARDARWMLELLAPRVIAGAAGRHRQLELDDADFARSRQLIGRALEGGRQMTRGELYEVLEWGGVTAAGQRGIHVLGRLAQEGLICFGPRRGKQHTFVLLDEWVPDARRLAREEALAELARRYFSSHGPATLQDFAWWSGLRVSDARAAVDLVRSQFVQEAIGGQTYWLPDTSPPDRSPDVYLLPPFDEYLVAYRDRSATLDPLLAPPVNNALLGPTVVVDGRFAGTWKRALNKKSVAVATQRLVDLTDAECHALASTADRYGRFLGMPVVLT